MWTAKEARSERYLKTGLIAMTVAVCVLAPELGAFAQSSPKEPLRGSTTITVRKYQPTGYFPTNRHVRRADILVDEFALDAARDLYRKVLETDPNNAGAWNGLGKVIWYRTTSNNQNHRDDATAYHNEAIRHFVRALAIQPDYVEARLNLGSIYMEQGRYEDAKEEFERAHQIAPHDSRALERLGAIHTELKHYNEALPYLEEAVLQDSGNHRAHYYLGRVQLNRGQFDQAHKHLQTALYQYPNHAPAHMQLGVLYEMQGNGAAAVNEYKQALAIKPELHEAAERLADYYESRGDLAAALESLKNIWASESQSFPANWSLIDRVARLSLKNQQPEVAIDVYRRWLKERPGDHNEAAQLGLSDAQTELARMKRRDDDLVAKGDAARIADQALNTNPNNIEARLIQAKLDEEIGVDRSAAKHTDGRPKDPRMIDVALRQPSFQSHEHLQKGELLLYRYQFNEADAAFRAARRSAASAQEALDYGELFMLKGMPHLAEESFLHVLKFMPDNEAAKRGIAQVQHARKQSGDLVRDARFHVRKNYIDKAIRESEEAIKHNVRNADAHYLLGVLYERRKNYAKAADHYYAYLMLSPGAVNRRTVENRIERLKGRMLKAQR